MKRDHYNQRTLFQFPFQVHKKPLKAALSNFIFIIITRKTGRFRPVSLYNTSDQNSPVRAVRLFS